MSTTTEQQAEPLTWDEFAEIQWVAFEALADHMDYMTGDYGCCPKVNPMDDTQRMIELARVIGGLNNMACVDEPIDIVDLDDLALLIRESLELEHHYSSNIGHGNHSTPELAERAQFFVDRLQAARATMERLVDKGEA